MARFFCALIFWATYPPSTPKPNEVVHVVNLFCRFAFKTKFSSRKKGFAFKRLYRASRSKLQFPCPNTIGFSIQITLTLNIKPKNPNSQ